MLLTHLSVQIVEVILKVCIKLNLIQMLYLFTYETQENERVNSVDRVIQVNIKKR